MIDSNPEDHQSDHHGDPTGDLRPDPTRPTLGSTSTRLVTRPEWWPTLDSTLARLVTRPDPTRSDPTTCTTTTSHSPPYPSLPPTPSSNNNLPTHLPTTTTSNPEISIDDFNDFLFCLFCNSTLFWRCKLVFLFQATMLRPGLRPWGGSLYTYYGL
jgi:hypothetical protein